MIRLKTVRWKNFLATGNRFLEVNLDQDPMMLVVGKNGAGKSTLIDAITFSLFGKPFKKVNKGQLVNSVNERDTLTEIEFSVGTAEWKVRRGIKPNLFEIYHNDNLVNQDAKSMDYQKYLEDKVLKLNFKSFTQIVVLGSASFVPFMQLTANDRRIIIEDILDIGIFSIMGYEISLPIIAAFLTIVGYSLNDTIVIFDRIRENVKSMKRLTYTQVVDHSINDSLSRTIITSVTTFIVVLVLWLFGGEVIKLFAFAMMVGVIVGTYSSIFVACPFVLRLHAGK